MKKKIILASNNAHKVTEIQAILTDFEILTLAQIGFQEEIDEVGQTFEENAMLKAVSVYDATEEIAVLADDSGLEVVALQGEPGIFSARYAGTGNAADNITKLLKNLENQTDRKAQFRCVLCLFDGRREQYFEGIVTGSITTEPRGKNGFGYDSIFMPDGFNKTFAELSEAEKNAFSHRNKALQSMKESLTQSYKSSHKKVPQQSLFLR